MHIFGDDACELIHFATLLVQACPRTRTLTLTLSLTRTLNPNPKQARAAGQRLLGACMFTCAGRGASFFGAPAYSHITCSG